MSPTAVPARACTTSVSGGEREVSGAFRSLMKRVAEPVQRLKKGMPLPRPSPCSTYMSYTPCLRTPVLALVIA